MSRGLLFMVLCLTAGCSPDGLVFQKTPHDVDFASKQEQARRSLGLPLLSSLGAEGVRLWVEPSFGTRNYVIDVVPQPLGCRFRAQDSRGIVAPGEKLCSRAMINAVHWPHEQYGAEDEAVGRFSFVAPREDVWLAVERFVERTAKWRGQPCFATDGTNFGAQWTTSDGVASVRSNCLRNSDAPPVINLGLDVQRILLAYGPTGKTPRSADWHLPETSSEYPCNNPELNVADLDGFGVGQDSCALWLKQEHQR